jgi:hypothetical protein
MLTFLISLSCPEGYHRLHHSILIVEYHRRKVLTLNPKTYVFGVLSAAISFKDEDG